MKKILREYQINSLNETRESMKRGSKAVIINAPTGAGKTVIISELIRLAAEKGSTIIFLAHRKELIEQCSARLYDNEVHHGIIKSGIPPTITAKVQVASIQTLVRRNFTPPNILVIDECHHARASTYHKIIDRCPGAVIIGLTATPCRIDGKGLGTIFQEIITVTNTTRLIEEGFLVPFRVWSPTAIDSSMFRMEGGDFNKKQIDVAMRKSSIYGDIISTWKGKASGRQTVVFGTSVEHSQELRDAFKAAGIIAEHVDGTTPQEERGRLLSDFVEGKIQVITNCGILTEGWDCPPVGCLVIARPTASLSLHLQIVGRGLRTFPGKEDCIILDHAGNHVRHGFVTDEREWSLASGVKKKASEGGGKSSAVKTCKKCYLCLPSTATSCPECGYVFPEVKRKPDHRHSDMEELTKGEPKYKTKLDPLTFFAEKTMIGESRGYRSGWAKHQFKLTFNKWPMFDPEDIEVRKFELGWKGNNE